MTNIEVYKGKLDETLLNLLTQAANGEVVGIVAEKVVIAKDVLARAKTLMSDEMKELLTTNNKLSIQFKSGGVVKVEALNGNAFRGYSTQSILLYNFNELNKQSNRTRLLEFFECNIPVMYSRTNGNYYTYY